MPSVVSKEPEAATAARRNSRFGLGKHRRQKTSLSDIKVDLHESHAEKEARRLKSYADPNMAVRQLEPAAMALEQSTMSSLAMRQHKDIFGNPIADPDLSNPTRHRLERPLDTIRSFEAAIEESYHTRRTSYGNRAIDQQPTHDLRYGYPTTPSATAAFPPAPRPHHRTRGAYDSTSSSPASSQLDDDDPSAAAMGGAVQAPPNTLPAGPYGYANPGLGSSRSRHVVPPPQWPTPPTSQAGMAWASAPARVAPVRKPVGGGGEERRRGWLRRKLGRKE